MRDALGYAAPHLRPADDEPTHMAAWLTLYTVIVMGIGGVCGWLAHVVLH